MSEGKREWESEDKSGAGGRGRYQHDTHETQRKTSIYTHIHTHTYTHTYTHTHSHTHEP